MKKLYFKLGTIGALMLFVGSCSDEFLEEKPKGTVSEEILTTASGVDLLLVGAYARIDGYSQGEAGGTGGASATNWVWGGDVPSDDMHRGGDQTGGGGAQSTLLNVMRPIRPMLGSKNCGPLIMMVWPEQTMP